jgi:hypothetical protein
MCDYSLTVEDTRPAIEGERLVVHRFFNGVQGFISRTDPFGVPKSEPTLSERVMQWFRPSDACAVCLQPGSRLILREIPEALRSQLHANPEEEVTFTQCGSPDAFRDAIHFQNGAEVLIQELPVGMVADVLTTKGLEISPTIETQIEASPSRIA